MNTVCLPLRVSLFHRKSEWRKIEDKRLRKALKISNRELQKLKSSIINRNLIYESAESIQELEYTFVEEKEILCLKK